MQWVDNTGNGPYYWLPTPRAHLGRTSPRPGWTAQLCAKAQSMYWSGNHKAGPGRGTPDLNGDSAAIKDLRGFRVAGPKHVRLDTWTPSVVHDISYQKP